MLAGWRDILKLYRVEICLARESVAICSVFVPLFLSNVSLLAGAALQ